MTDSQGRHPKLILASQSPRRSALLQEAGYHFEVLPSTVDESSYYRQGMDPEVYARTLALAKAQAVARLRPEDWVLGADTIVDCQGKVIGKARDAAHAEQITREVFAQVHRVITGMALVCEAVQREIVTADTTVVYPKPFSEEQIVAHIQGGSWQGKAGAYAIQETGDQFVDHLDGSLSNVIGLPLELLARVLPDGIGRKP